jgi:hypothetical protein
VAEGTISLTSRDNLVNLLVLIAWYRGRIERSDSFVGLVCDTPGYLGGRGISFPNIPPTLGDTPPLEQII